MKRVLVDACAPGPATLGPDEAHYARDVLRLSPSDTVRAFDAEGNEAVARVTGVSRHAVALEIGPVDAAPPRRAAVVLLGLPRPALVEEAITLGTEAGATAFWLFPAARSLPAPPRLDRLERIALAAARQSRRGRPAALRGFGDLGTALAEARGLGGLRVFGDLDAAARPAVSPGDVAVAVGPEGGWTAAERAQLLAEGWEGARLADDVLRAPTAVAVALALTRW